MTMKSSVCVFSLILVLLKVLYCGGCWKHEREALLAINNAYFGNSLPWVNSTDCCKWDRVECNATTGRVAKLDLSAPEWWDDLGEWRLNYSHFLVFKDMKNLNLSGKHIDCCVEKEALGLNNLEVLDLSYTVITDYDILSCVPSSLKALYLRMNELNETSFQGLFSMLINLEVLDMSYCITSNNDIESALSELSSIKSLNLADCELNSRSVHGISKLRTLEILDLANNQLEDSVLEKKGFAWPTNLQFLGLSENSFSNEIFSSLSGLRYLKSLDLSNNQLEGSLNISGLALSNLEVLDFSDNKITNFVVRQDWSGLKMLEELNISSNEFKGPLPPYFANLSTLRKLDISYNHFTGNIGSNLASLTSLEYLGFEGNQFEVPISFTPFSNHSNLKFVYGDGNKVILDSHSTLETWVPKFQLQVLSLSSRVETNSLSLPSFLHYQYNLTYLDFTGCKLGGEFPNWLLENNTKMSNLILKNCSFTQFQLPSRPHLHLIEMDVSNNAITGQIPSDNISSIFPNLEMLHISKNAIHGSIPREFGQMKLLETLDLSDNHFSGEIPHELSNMSSLQTLDLSNNQLFGEIPEGIFGVGYQSGGLTNRYSLSFQRPLESLLLNGNSLTGRLPRSIFNTSITSFDISNNHLVGKIPSLIKNLSSLRLLSMSNNRFEGCIPLELAQHENLIYLDLSQNNLIGVVPSFINSSVKVIHLNSNHLSGLSKRMFGERSSIKMLDLSYNEITNSIQDMIQDPSHSRLNILLLKGNHFTGDIPRQVCQLSDLSILDLSHNNFSGVIPNCLGKMPFENKDPEQLYNLFYGFIPLEDNSRFESHLPNVQEKANFTSKKRTDTYTGSILVYMSGIDLSHNKLKGNIPSELGNLTRIRSLNLSYNDLTGQIPTTFSNLVQTESLDLSFNKLSGQIPPQLIELTFLAVFSVAHNNLSGATPERKGQFSTFDESSYEGNLFLCGPPLPKSCNPPPAILPNDSDADGDSGSLVDMFVFCVSFAISYTTALLATAAALYINPYWRRAWFYYIELVSMNCYYFILDNVCKCFKNRNM